MTKFFHNFLMQALNKSNDSTSLKLDTIIEPLKNINTLLNQSIFNFKLEVKKPDDDIANLSTRIDLIEEYIHCLKRQRK